MIMIPGVLGEYFRPVGLPKTVLLLHMNSDFSDSSIVGSPPTVSNATIDTVTKKFGAGSGHIVPTDTVTYPANNEGAWNFSGQNVTIDFWLNPSSWPISGNNSNILVVGLNTFAIGSTGPNWIRFDGGGVSTGAVTISSWTGSFKHIALVVNSGTWNLYLDGVSQASGSGSLGDFSANTVILESGGDGATTYNIDELRIINGAAYWTANFTPPTAEY